MTRRPLAAAIAGLAVMAGSGCSMQKVVVRQTAGVLLTGIVALERETDPELAEAALPGNLLMLESFLAADPGNTDLLLLLAKGYGSYVFLFIEDRVEQAALAEDLALRDHLTARGAALYLRARRYAFALLGRPELERAGTQGTLDEFEVALAEVGADQAEALFWLANAWGGYVNLAKTEPDAIAQIGKVEALVGRAVELDPRYYFATGYTVLGLLAAMRPKLLGGDPEKARRHFDQALGLSEGRFLMASYLMARWYAVQIQDAALFRKLLGQVLDAPADVLPEANLANAVAKRRARRWLDNIDLLFENPGTPGEPDKPADEAIDEAESDF